MSKTSTNVKRKYNEKTYSRIYIALPKELVNEFKLKCKENGDSQASVIKTALEEYIKK